MPEPTTTTTETDPVNSGNEDVHFDPKQTERVTAIVKDRLSREQAKHAKDSADTARELAEAKTRLAELEAKQTTNIPNSTADTDKVRAEIDEIKRVAATREAENKALLKQLADKDTLVASTQKEAMNVRKQAEINAAASQIGFYDLNMVSAVLADRITYSEEYKQFVVNGDGGTPELNSAYKPKSLQEFFSDYATKNPWTVKSGIVLGTGGSENNRRSLSSDGKHKVTDLFGKGSNAGLANKVALENPAEYGRLRLIAKEQRLI